MYKIFFKNAGIMPNVTAMQSPFVLFKMLDSMEDEYSDEPLTEHLKMFYGE